MIDFLRHLFSSVNKNSRTNHATAAFQQARAYNKSRSKKLHHSICLAPSVNMVFSTDGTVRVCCHNYENTIGTYPAQSIQQIWQGAHALAFRKKMADFQMPSGCGACSFNYQNNAFEEMPSLGFDNKAPVEDYPKMMEFLLANTCNLECVMCTGELSSSIRSNRDKLPPLQSPYDQNFLEELKPFIPHLLETRFSSSGEAFAIDMNYKLWDMILALNPTCDIYVQTNGTMLNARIKDYLARGNFRIGVSIDSIEKNNYEAIRLNARFEQVMNNINYFAQYTQQRNKTFQLSYCVMRQNWHEIPAFVNYCNSLNAEAVLHKVFTPLTHSLHNLPPLELQDIYHTLAAATLPDATPMQAKNKRHFEYFLSVIKLWQNQATQNIETEVDYTHLSLPELQQIIHEKLSQYIQQHEVLETDKAALTAHCIQKINQVINLLQTELQQKQALAFMLQVPTRQMIGPIKTMPAEKLMEMAKTNL